MQELDPVPRPIDHLTARGQPDEPALIMGSETIDFAGLERRVGAVARCLVRHGVQPGDRVATWLPKTMVACVMPLAVARIGAVHVPINPVLKRAQAAYILADSGARLLVTGEGRRASLEARDISADCRLVLEQVFEPDPETAFGASEIIGLSDQDTNALAALLYTSGSTGPPKGVMISHANLWLGAISVAHYLGLRASDRTLCVLPFAFDYGQNQLLSTWAAGGCAVPLDYLSARDVVKAVDRHSITTLAGVPPLWVQLTGTEWPEATPLRRLTNSGGALTESLVRKLRAMFPTADIYAMYGLTEAFRSTYLDPALIDTHPAAIGSAIPFAEVLVVRPDGTVAAEGELVHCGPLVAQGYWRDAERTAERFPCARRVEIRRHGSLVGRHRGAWRRRLVAFRWPFGRDDQIGRKPD